MRLYVTNPGNGPDVYLTCNDWEEDTVAWNNCPSEGQKIADLRENPIGWMEVDVTGRVNGPGTYSFLLQVGSIYNNGLDYHSREGENRPEPIVTTIASVQE